MLLDEDLPDPIRHGLQVVLSQAYRAGKIVRNMPEFARRSDPEKRPLSIGSLVRRSLEMKSHEFHVNDISVVEKISGGLPLIKMDEHLILQVLLNVLTKAEQACVAANGRGGEITISATTDNALIDITVQDDGPGIPPDQLTKVFEPFYTAKETGAGTGLGLNASRGILSQHEGNIWAESVLGPGSTIHIELPAPVPVFEGPGAAPLPVDPELPLALDSARPTNHVLVVDDEPDLTPDIGKAV